MTKEVIGVEALQRKLKKVEKAVQPKLVAQSARAALVPMMKTARANAPRGTETHRTYKGRLVAPGFLERNIKLRKMKFRDKNRVGYSLAARGEAFYGKIIEPGFTHKGGRKKLGKQTKIPADPWLGKAERQHSSSVDRDFRRALLKRINKAKR